MTTTFKLEAGELNEHFFERLAAMFHDRPVEIVVYEADETSQYPLDNPAQMKYLDDALERAKNPKNLVPVDPQQLRKS